jgi:diguanylate cyclase (GGDEF)-like protein
VTVAGAPPIPDDEAERLLSLRALGILDTPAEERFDRITRLVQRVLDVPMAAVTLVDSDRQWFKSRQGLADPETPRDQSFCAHAMVHSDGLYVGDATQDPRFSSNPLVLDDPSIRFYAGSPIKGPDGARLGSLCAIDSRPRELSEEDFETLRDLAEMVEQEIASEQLAISDALTGLSNRRGFALLGTQVVQVAKRMGFPVTLLFVDLDGMKAVNDSLGHAEGDRLLKDATAVLEATFRGSDVIARVGGDEFCVLLTGTAAEGVGDAIDRLEQAVAERNGAGDRPYELCLSVGRSEALGDRARPLEQMLQEADAAMYEHKRSKNAGRDQRG